MPEPLQQEIAALDQFIEILQQEQNALVEADVPALMALSETKLKLSEQLNALSRERTASVKQAGFTADAEGVRKWLSNQPDATAKAWDLLMEKARTAQRLNQTNGKLITIHLQHNQQALAVLMNASSQAGMYGPDGQPRVAGTPGSRIIGKV